MEVQNVDMISGSTRLPNAKWSLNCYQMQHENYQLKLLDGYRQSTSESCLVCDYVRGPFLAKTKLFKELKFSAKIQNQDISFVGCGQGSKKNAKSKICVVKSRKSAPFWKPLKKLIQYRLMAVVYMFSTVLEH